MDTIRNMRTEVLERTFKDKPVIPLAIGVHTHFI